MNNNVLSCIMAYYPGKEFKTVCDIIARQTTFLLIIDNSPDCSLTTSDFLMPDNAIIVSNKNNGAVAGALNIGLELAIFKKFDYLQIFDQDTMLPPNLTESLIKNIQARANAAIISPRFINSSTNFPGRVLAYTSKWWVKSYWPKNNIGIIDALFTISSASIIDIKKLPENTYYDRKLYIDGCDVDFCLHLQNLGFDILVDTSNCVYHGIGSRKKGGGRWSATNYSPFRKQLGAKNRTIVWRRYITKYPGFIINDCFVFTLDIARTIMFEEEKFAKIKAIFIGIYQGMQEKEIHHRNYIIK